MRNYTEILRTKKGDEVLEVFYGATNKLFAYKPSDKAFKISVFVGDLCALTLNENNEIEKYSVSYNDGGYVFDEKFKIHINDNSSIEEVLKKEAIKLFNSSCSKKEQIIDSKYVKKGILGLKYL